LKTLRTPRSRMIAFLALALPFPFAAASVLTSSSP
jgi:hypothetical protein